ncbi:proteobacterial dedicated sortase system histidine kinase [Alteromonas oceanisediminis]|uniref:proteobacterial dedicated sortase system histidine kinase n=1 Tax=Alteromonas oceanisediminis TaxID=2836180 RepID=UPI001BDADC16|nr:proteobacterial dedicated sortase system histidine kinase [Alteromonas oceanisediminis]MBT0587672.1 proteobacterial dedicated sortase system histidine kinase [Alteromonas oceanisediminis]
MKLRLRVPIRFQLLLMSGFLLAIPLIGYRYVWELEAYLRSGQEQTMIGTARAVATALHERENLFSSPATQRETVRPGTDLYAVPMREPIKLDGQFNDWTSALPLTRFYDEQHQIPDIGQASMSANTLSFTHAVGKYQQWVYAMFAVKDDVWVFRGPNSLAVDESDHLLIAMTPQDSEVQRYVISPRASGWVNGYQLKPGVDNYEALRNENRIQGRWVDTPDGYNIEIRFPLAMTSGDLAFALVDVDDSRRRTKVGAIGTADPNQQESLGTIATQSTDIERLLKSLQYTNSRVWVVDKHLRVLARSGSIQDAVGLQPVRRQSNAPRWWHQLEQNYLLPLYYTVLTKPSNDFIDELDNAYALQGKDIANALTGQADALWRLSPDNKAVILSAAHPIYLADKVIGAVIVEQTTNGIRTVRNQALEELFHGMLAVMTLAILMIMLFSTRISNRIRRLRDQTEAVIDDNGKIIGQLKPMARFDEIGDLSASFGNVLNRLSHYNQYLENMASRLSHELRTPVAIVRSSLENLSLAKSAEQQQPFVERALGGINRLSHILTRMSEATRLESALASTEKVSFDVVSVVNGCADSYRTIYTANEITLKCSAPQIPLNGVPDLFAQMLDKIVSNAVEFSSTSTPITLHLWREGNKAFLTVTNQGPLLPDGLQNELFQSMVSVRSAQLNEPPGSVHLGLGLYIARIIAEFHRGDIKITNLPDKTGVCVMCSFML